MSRTLLSGGHVSAATRKEACIPLCDRLEYLPLLLAGPLLRRTERDAVTVWVALKEPREVTLNVYATDANGSRIKTLLLQGTRSTVPLGKYLHVVAVTAKPVGGGEGERGGDFRLKPGSGVQNVPHSSSSEQSTSRDGVQNFSNFPSSLEPGQIYAYDLSFGDREQNLDRALKSELFPHVTVSYFQHQLPTFALPPDDLNDLRLAHGSCRKLHGGGLDALPILDDLIEHYAKEPKARLHQLFFTGDQIYGDDVADPLLWVATQVGDTLLGWEENLPMYQTLTTDYVYKKPSQLKPGERTNIARDCCSFTAMLINCPEKAKSHLFSLGEYFATYLLAWSPILWSQTLPQGKHIYQDRKQAKLWDEEARHIKDCMNQLWKVRRAMANVPIYMIFDDHDVTDDWYLNRAWCTSVLSKPLGRRTVQNAMLAYAVFQGWGNTPNQFQEGQPGGKLLNAAMCWSASAGTDELAWEEIAKLVGIPLLEPETGLPKLKRDGDVLILDRDYPDGTLPIEWHYAIRSHKHEVLVLDTRTWRGYPVGEEERGGILNPKSEIQNPKWHEKEAIAPPMLLCPTAFKTQLQKPLELTDQLKKNGESDIEVTFVVLPTNVVSLSIIDVVQRVELEKGNVFNSDVGDAWNLNEVALSMLLAELFQRRRIVVVLSGDIHYGATIRLSYWLNPCPEKTGDNRTSNVQSKIQNPGRYLSWEATSQLRAPKSKIATSPNSNQARVLAQLTASAFKNDELKTQLIHTKVKSLAPEVPQNWAGWHEPPELVEIQITPEKVRMLDVEVPATGPVVRQFLGVRGNSEIAWEIALKNDKSLPDWLYHIEWIKRQKAKLAPWLEQQASSTSSNTTNTTGLLAAAGNLVSMLWRNRWLQEGEEVIGYNNFGVVSLKWQANNDEQKAVIQDSYWRPPWKPTLVVYSRYFVPLHVDQPPPSLRVI
jgi:hypothetical protein